MTNNNNHNTQVGGAAGEAPGEAPGGAGEEKGGEQNMEEQMAAAAAQEEEEEEEQMAAAGGNPRRKCSKCKKNLDESYRFSECRECIRGEGLKREAARNEEEKRAIANARQSRSGQNTFRPREATGRAIGLLRERYGIQVDRSAPDIINFDLRNNDFPGLIDALVAAGWTLADARQNLDIHIHIFKGGCGIRFRFRDSELQYNLNAPPPPGVRREGYPDGWLLKHPRRGRGRDGLVIMRNPRMPRAQELFLKNTERGRSRWGDTNIGSMIRHLNNQGNLGYFIQFVLDIMDTAYLHTNRGRRGGGKKTRKRNERFKSKKSRKIGKSKKLRKLRKSKKLRRKKNKHSKTRKQ